MSGNKDDNGKLPIGLVDPQFIKDVAAVLQFGAKKYAPDNWKKVEGAEGRYYDALQRHLLDHQAGEIKDPESDLTHLQHAACNVMFLLYFERQRLKGLKEVG